MKSLFLFLIFVFSLPAFSESSIEWIHCANEYGNGEPRSCNFNDLRAVRFGNGDQWVYDDKFDGLAAYKCTKSNFPAAYFEWSGGPYRCEYSSETITEAVAKPMHCASRNDCSGMSDRLPAGSPSSNLAKVKNTTHAVTPDDTVGAFRTECKFSHFAYDDPLVYPSMPGMSHLHMFFGNDSVDAFSDTTALADFGGSTCDGGILNRSAYWVPALLDTKQRKPILAVKGLGMIGREFNWSCSSNPSNQVGFIPECSAGNHLNLAVQFPQCWDGENLWLANSAHVVNPENSQCPVTHPASRFRA